MHVLFICIPCIHEHLTNYLTKTWGTTDFVMPGLMEMIVEDKQLKLKQM